MKFVALNLKQSLWSGLRGARGSTHPFAKLASQLAVPSSQAAL